MCAASQVLRRSFSRDVVQYAVNCIEKLLTLERFRKKSADTKGAQLAFIQLVGWVYERDDQRFRQIIQFADLLAESREGHVLKVKVGEYERRTDLAGRLQGFRSILKPDDLITLADRNFFHHATDGRTAVDHKDTSTHLVHPSSWLVRR